MLLFPDLRRCFEDYECFNYRRWNSLKGKVTAQGCKNSALAILAAAALCEDRVYLTNVPDIGDVKTMMSILRSLGYKVTWGSGLTIKQCY